MGAVLLGRTLGHPAAGGFGELCGALFAANRGALDIVAVSRSYLEKLVDAFGCGCKWWLWYVMVVMVMVVMVTVMSIRST